MDFDQMLEAWKAQDEAPLYGVNADLLRLVLQNEQDKIRRTRRKAMWMTYIVGPGMALFAGFWLWVLIVVRGPTLQTIAAAVGAGLFVLWVGAFWVSHRRQARRERGFGNSLRDEIGRSLSMVEYQLANGTWAAGMLWIAPVMIGATLIYWLMFQINTDSGFSAWIHVGTLGAVAWAAVLVPYTASRDLKKKLGPRRERLREMLQTLDASE